jgi:hypothetical protein
VFEDLADPGNNFSYADGAVENRSKPPTAPDVTVICRRVRNSFSMRGDENSGRALDELLNCGVACNLGDALEDHGRGRLPGSEGAPYIFSRFHAKRVDAHFAKLSADGCAQFPIARNHENNRHLRWVSIASH